MDVGGGDVDGREGLPPRGGGGRGEVQENLNVTDKARVKPEFEKG